MTAINAMLVYLLGAVGPHLLRIAVAGVWDWRTLPPPGWCVRECWWSRCL
jgi:hypothetical protein